MTRVDSVLFVTYHFPPEVGGIQTRILGYLSEMSRRGIKSTVLLVRPSRRAARKHEGIDPSLALSARWVRLVSCDSGAKGLFPAAVRVLLIVGSGRPNVVHVFTGGATLLGVFTLLIGRLSRRFTTMSVFGREDATQTTWFGEALLMLSGTLATSISTNSDSTKGLLPAVLRGKTKVLLGGSWVPSSRASQWPDGKTVLFVGRLVKRKGVDDLLRAFAVTRSTVPESHLSIVGNGPERDNLERLAIELGLGDAVHFKGTLLGQSLASEYDNCTLCVLPSKEVPDDRATEGFGLALVEAAAHGKPLVGTDHGGIVEIIRDGVNGFVVPQGDPKGLGLALTRLLKDKELAQKMGASSLQIAKSDFNLQAATDRLLESYAR